MKRVILVLIVAIVASGVQATGPYTECGINGYWGTDRRHADPRTDPNARLHPVFRRWATGWRDYLPADEQWGGGAWNDPTKALGPATGDPFDIVSLGDLDAAEIAQGKPPGRITLTFGDPDDPNDLDDPNALIRDQAGYDFAVFENGVADRYDTAGGPVSALLFTELAFVEVSTDNVVFARFPAVCLTGLPQSGHPYLRSEMSNLYNLAGKHPNGYGYCTGTPFDLRELRDEPEVRGGLVDLQRIRYVRIVDVPGRGDWLDQAVCHVDPNSAPDWRLYNQNHPIYDPWLTWGSGGFDLEAVGVLYEQEYAADINLDGIVDLYDLELFGSAWLSRFGQDRWIGRCDLAEPKDGFINSRDLAVLARQWLQRERWH
ncbi:MAG: hypothetical protein JW810_08040 [Sedimentisphaerales bacterium]|nr:hypothetical protein [Sedimentisphaerales bacterium]